MIEFMLVEMVLISLILLHTADTRRFKIRRTNATYSAGVMESYPCMRFLPQRMNWYSSSRCAFGICNYPELTAHNRKFQFGFCYSLHANPTKEQTYYYKM